MTLAKLRVLFQADSKQYTQQIKTVQTQTQNAMSRMTQSADLFSGALTKIGMLLASVFSVTKLVSFAQSCIELASDLAEVQNVVDVTFGDMRWQIEQFAGTASVQFGLSQLAAKRFSSTMGAVLKSMGFGGQQLVDMSTTLAGLAGDIASFYNIDAEDAFGKIRSAITGITRPLMELGINLSEANLEEYRLAQGIETSYSAMTQAEKAMLRYQYLLSVTSDAQGDFARTSDSWANQTRIMAEQFNSLKAAIGEVLLNFLLPMVRVLNQALSAVMNLVNGWKALVATITGSTGVASAVGIISEDMGDIEEASAGTAASAASAKKTLTSASFDQLHKLADPSAGASGGGGGGGSSSIMSTMEEGATSGGGLGETLRGIFADWDLTSYREQIQNLQVQFSNLFNTIRDGAEWLWNNIIEPLWQTWVETVVPAQTASFAAFLDFADSLINYAGPYIQAFLEDYFYPFMEAVFGFQADNNWALADVFTRLADVLDEAAENGHDLYGVWDLLHRAFDDPDSFGFLDFMASFEHLGRDWDAAVIRWFQNPLKGMQESFMFFWNTSIANGRRSIETIKGIFTNGIPFLSNVWTANFQTMGLVGTRVSAQIAEAWYNLPATLKGVFSNIVNYFTNYWNTMSANATNITNAIKTNVTNAFNGTWSNITSTVNSIKANVTSAFTGLRDNAVNAVNTMKANIANTVGGLWTSFRSGMNNILVTVETGINGIIAGINKMISNINKASNLGSFLGLGGLPHLGYVWLPRLAEGGIATSSVVANIGENGREAVLPLDRNTGWMDELGARIAQLISGNGGGAQTINTYVTLDGKVIAKAVNRLNERDNRRYSPVGT